LLPSKELSESEKVVKQREDEERMKQLSIKAAHVANAINNAYLETENEYSPEDTTALYLADQANEFGSQSLESPSITEVPISDSVISGYKDSPFEQLSSMLNNNVPHTSDEVESNRKSRNKVKLSPTQALKEDVYDEDLQSENVDVATKRSRRHTSHTNPYATRNAARRNTTIEHRRGQQLENQRGLVENTSLSLQSKSANLYGTKAPTEFKSGGRDARKGGH